MKTLQAALDYLKTLTPEERKEYEERLYKRALEMEEEDRQELRKGRQAKKK